MWPEGDLVAAGVDKAIAHQIYTDMAYLDSLAGMVVVNKKESG